MILHQERNIHATKENDAYTFEYNNYTFRVELLNKPFSRGKAWYCEATNNDKHYSGMSDTTTRFGRKNIIEHIIRKIERW